MMAKQLGWLGVLFVTGCLSRPLVEQAPETNNVFVDKIQQTAIDKIDLLFMIDNSASMSDKQEILKEAVPVLLSRLVSPICVDGLGKSTGVNALPNGKCPDNKGEPEFSPIGDIHIGIVSSSLGGHGGHQCAPANGASINPNDDKAHLVGSMRSSDLLGRTWDASGFLAWDSFGKANKPPGSADPGELNSAFRDMLGAVGESGCGYEASLESWYRFLVDPEPPALVGYSDEMTLRSSRLTVNPDGSPGACVGCDEALLAQRKAFLRPDSLVAIIMLTDENDCSIRDDSKGWWVSSTGPLKRGTSQCDRNPNDPCCRSCDPKAEANGPPAGCPSSSEDSACKEPNPNDSTNLRCYDQRRRFGFDLLYETSRYVDALTKTTLPLQSSPGTVVKNPLFDGGTEGKAPRDPSLVFLAGIVGVPWQDIADQASLGGPGLTYLTAKELKEQGRWQALLGDPSASPPQPPSDPFMVETLNERAGTNPFVGVSIAPAKSTDPHQNPINGHEQDLSKKQDDLQYACIFPLKTPKPCEAHDLATNSPLCQGNLQISGKAYPGTRELSVLKGLGENAIVASICPKVIDAADPNHPSADPNFGYNPAINAIMKRLEIYLVGKCLPRTLKTDGEGKVLCRVVEAQKRKDDCSCQLAGRDQVPPDILASVQRQLRASGECGVAGKEPCSDLCLCEIKQVDSAHLKACQTKAGGVPPGYCYIDDQAKVGADASGQQAIESQLAICASNERHRLRFVDSDPAHKTPADGAVAFISCVGDAIPDEPSH